MSRVHFSRSDLCTLRGLLFLSSFWAWRNRWNLLCTGDTTFWKITSSHTHIIVTWSQIFFLYGHVSYDQTFRKVWCISTAGVPGKYWGPFHSSVHLGGRVSTVGVGPLGDVTGFGRPVIVRQFWMWRHLSEPPKAKIIVKNTTTKEENMQTNTSVW